MSHETPAAASPESDDSSVHDAGPATSRSAGTGSYVVVARRYRPRTFGDLVGQGHISQALTNAINSNRVGHAYLFTGARGVGKTSTARIFAKALNAPDGPTANPDNDSDICRAIDAGEDVDVLEIDGASNRGIDEIRQLRSNAGVRPSRARFKIYIIDEVHMLTTAAFNALLKTLEEPPAHVKFIFCTTDPQKIPITVLSRCQRYDFAPVDVASIVERLEHIVSNEGREADSESLELLARRAEGSMRDSQSLLEQLLAFCSGRIKVDDVHQMLGTAASGLLSTITQHLVARDAAAVFLALDAAVSAGVDCGQLAEQLLGYLRDLMAIQVGCPAESLRHTPSGDQAGLEAVGQQIGLASTLAAFEILDQAVGRMRQSTQPRLLLEVALIRICNLADLDQLSALIDQLSNGGTVPAAAASRPPAEAVSSPPASRSAAPIPVTAPVDADSSAPQKKNPPVADNSVSTAAEPPSSRSLTPQSADAIWKQALDSIGDMTADFASYYDHVAISAPDSLAVHFREAYTLQKESSEQPERKAQLEQALSRVVGRSVRIEFSVIPELRQQRAAVSAPSIFQLMREKESDPFVRQAVELFEAEVVKVDVPRNSRSTEDGSPTN